MEIVENITYFTGAGASYQSLPLMDQISERLGFFSTFLEIQVKNGLLTHPFSDQFIKDLDSLIIEINNRTSIDAYAKELAISSKHDAKDKLSRLKIILSNYLIFEQIQKPSNAFIDKNIDVKLILSPDLIKLVNNPIDKRYRTFWVNNLNENKNVLDDNINIISWNYDLQFESSYSDIKNYPIELTQKTLQVYPSTKQHINLNESCVIKLNGTAGLYHSRNDYHNLFDPNQHLFKDILHYMIDTFQANYNILYNKPVFYFAWEDEEVVRYAREYAKKIIKNTNKLVIIGYSFPDFNREIDKEIFSEIENLKEVYYQVPKEGFEESRNRIKKLNPDLLKLITSFPDLKTFYHFT